VGKGVRLFKDGRSEQALTFVRSSTFPSGLVQLWYDATNSGTETKNSV
jgi:dihydrofolate reductase